MGPIIILAMKIKLQKERCQKKLRYETVSEDQLLWVDSPVSVLDT